MDSRLLILLVLGFVLFMPLAGPPELYAAGPGHFPTLEHVCVRAGGEDIKLTHDQRRRLRIRARRSAR